MKRSVILAAGLLSALAAGNALAVETVKATVNGMVCAFCAQGIEKRLSKLPAAQAVFVDLKGRVVAVEAKSGQTIDATVVANEIKESGYDVVRIETVSQPVAELRAQAKAR